MSEEKCKYCKGYGRAMDHRSCKTYPCFYCKGTGKLGEPSLLEKMVEEGKIKKADPFNPNHFKRIES